MQWCILSLFYSAHYFRRKKTMARKMKTMDGNNAAAYVSYAFTEVAGI